MSLEGVVVKVTCNTTRVGETKLTIRSIGADDFVYLNYSSGSANAPGLNIEPDEPDEPFETDGNSADKVSFEPWNNGSTSLYEVTQAAKVYAEGQTIVIESPVEQSAVVCDIAGRGQTVNLMEGRNEIPVNSSGIYIVRIREKTVKLLLK